MNDDTIIRQRIAGRDVPSPRRGPWPKPTDRIECALTVLTAQTKDEPTAH